MSNEQLKANDQWWVEIEGKSTGPYSTGYVSAALRSHLILADQRVRPVSEAEWRAAQGWPQLGTFLPSRTPETPPTETERSPRPVERATALGKLFPAEMVIQLVAIYGIAISPLIWPISSFTSLLSGTTYAEGSDAEGVHALLTIAAIFFGFVQGVFWFAAGFLLNRFNRRGSWLAIGLGLSSWFGLGIVLFVEVAMTIAFSATQQRVLQPSEIIASICSLAIDSVDLMLQTLCSFLLWKHRHSIPYKATN
jgi:hypothetical protein